MYRNEGRYGIIEEGKSGRYSCCLALKKKDGKNRKKLLTRGALSDIISKRFPRGQKPPGNA